MTEIIIGVVCNYVYDISRDLGMRIFFKVSRKRFIKRLEVKVEEITINSESKYSDTSAFLEFIEYSKPIQKVLENATNYNNPKEITVLIDELIIEAESVADIHNYKLTQCDKIFLKDLFMLINKSIHNYYSKKLNEKQKFMLSQKTQSAARIERLLKDGFTNQEELMKELKGCGRLRSYNQESIAELLCNMMLEGRFEDLEEITPLLEAESEDLSLLVRILKREFILNNTNPRDTYYELTKINNQLIKESVVRSILPIIYLRSIPIKGWDVFCQNDVLKKIVLSIENKEYEAIIKQRIIDDSDGLKKCEISISEESLKGEERLTKQLLLIYLYKNTTADISNLLDDIEIEMDSWLNKLLCFSREVYVLNCANINNLNNKRIKELVDDLINDKELYSSLTSDIKQIYYDTLIRGLMYIEDDRVEGIISSLPHDISEYCSIKERVIEYKIKNSEIDIKEVLSFCKENDRYGLLHIYVVEKCSISETVDLIENNDIDLKKCSEVFFMYVAALVNNKEKEKAKHILKEYYLDYNEFFEYWNLLLIICDSEQYIDEFVSKCKDNSIRMQYAHSELDIIKLLIQLAKYDLAIKYVKNLIIQNRYLVEANKLKALILKRQGKYLECLELLKSIFEKDPEDEMVLDDILCISLLNKRDIDEKCIDVASKSSNARLLSLAADAYVTKDRILDARTTMIKALLADDSHDNNAFGRYLALNLGENESDKEYKRVENNTAVYLNSDDGDTHVYCIYEDKILPTSPYKWHGDIHLYTSEAAKMGIYGKTLNSKVTIADNEYYINDIISLEAYFMRICISNAVELGSVRRLAIPVKDGKIDDKAFASQLKDMIGDEKENTRLIESYNNFADVPVPLFTIKKDSNATYTHFIMALLEDQNICLREGRTKIIEKSNSYVLSYASMIVMMKIGITPEEIKTHNTFVPVSAVGQVRDDVKEMLKRYDKEMVSSIGIHDGKLFLNEEGEELKNKWIQEAGKCKEYVDRLETVQNSFDWSIKGVEAERVKNTLGMVDYDAIAIGKKDGYTLVSTEFFTSHLGLDPNINYNTISITSWLINNDYSCLDVIKYVHKMIKIGCVLSVNDDFIRFVFKAYEECNSDEQNLILKEMQFLFAEYDKMPDSYREYAIIELMVYLRPILQEFDSSSTLFRFMLSWIIRLLKKRVNVQIDEKGKSLVEIEPLDSDE